VLFNVSRCLCISAEVVLISLSHIEEKQLEKLLSYVKVMIK